MAIEISDDDWFEAIAHPETARGKFPFALPSIPPESVQRGYNAKQGIDSLKHAFAVYRCVRSRLPARPDPVVMDFGAGWGRIARFFLKDTRPENIWAVDPREKSVTWMRKTRLPCTIVQSQPLPPIPGVSDARFDLIYANSVFSHLSEEYFNAWMPCLLSLLRPDGRLVFTTRGQKYLDRVEERSRQKDWPRKELFGDVGLLKARYARGEFVYVRPRAEAAESHFGHAAVPRAYFEARYPGCLLDFSESVPGIGQAVMVAHRAA